jgi:hypothetical protein
MPSEVLEFLKLLVTFVGGGFATLVLGPPLKNWWDRRRLIVEQQQTRWAPLRRAARSLESRLGELAAIYAEQPPSEAWKEFSYQLGGRSMGYPSKARDFCELYILDGERGPITDFYAYGLPSPIVERLDSDKVNKMWTRLHELTYAASSMHKTAEYLGYAERVRTELEDGRLLVAGRDRVRLLELLRSVSGALQGATGAGVINEHQQLIGQNVWRDSDSVIDLFAFYGMLLGRDWPKFTALFRFYIHVQWKMDTEVRQTRAALIELSGVIEDVFPTLRAN